MFTPDQRLYVRSDNSEDGVIWKFCGVNEDLITSCLPYAYPNLVLSMARRYFVDLSFVILYLFPLYFR